MKEGFKNSSRGEGARLCEQRREVAGQGAPASFFLPQLVSVKDVTDLSPSGTGSCDRGGVASPKPASRPAGWTPREQRWGGGGAKGVCGHDAPSSGKAPRGLAAAHSRHTGQRAVVSVGLFHKMRHFRVNV